jgi:hypothetical protein
VIGGTLTLTVHSLTRIRAMLAALGLMLAGFEFLLTQVAGYLTRQNAFSGLASLIPDFVQNTAGPSTLAFMSFGGIVGFGYFHPIVMTALVGVVIAIATEPAAEVEMRFVDLTLARPVGRTAVMTRSVLVLAFAVTGMLALMMIGTGIGVACCTPADAEAPSFGTVLSLAVNLAALMACWGGVTLAVAASARRRAVAGAIAGAAAFASYLLDYLGRAWEPARAASRLSPFHYFESMPIIMGEPLGLDNLAVLFGIGLAGAAIGYFVFTKRDL